MDPNETLRQIRAITSQLIRGSSGARTIERQAELGIELAELSRDLDEWLSKGGFYPQNWANQAHEY